MLPHVELRRDHISPYEWPAEAAHDYRVPRIIDFEETGKCGSCYCGPEPSCLS